MKDNIKFRIDRKLIIFYITVIIISLSFIGYKMYTTEECPEIKFDISDNIIEAGEIVQFYNRTIDTKSVKWDFGDNSVQMNERNPAHTYSRAGEYILKITINNSCTKMQKIIVAPKKQLINVDLIPRFACPTTVLTGQPISFTCLTKDAKKYEWRFGETGKVDSKDQNPTYKYKSPGPKTVSLIINDKYTYIAKKVVYVMAPEMPKNIKKDNLPKSTKKTEPVIPQNPDEFSSYDAVKTAPVVEKEKEKTLSNDELSAAIISYGNNRFKSSQFTPSLCGNSLSITIVANGKLMAFSEFLDKIKGQSISISTIRTIRETNGCISQIILKYKK